MNKNYSSHEYQYIYWETHILMIHFPCLYKVNWDDWSMLLFFPLHCSCIRILSSKRKINTTPTPVCLLFNSIAVCLFSFTETIQLKCMWNYFHTFFCLYSIEIYDVNSKHSRTNIIFPSKKQKQEKNVFAT